MISTDDRQDLRDLFARLAFNLDAGNAEQFADDYTADGVFHATGIPEAPGGTVVCTGREQLMGFVRMVFTGTKGGRRHWNDNFVFTEVDHDHVIVDSYFIELRSGVAPQAGVLLTAKYRDRVVRQDGRWLVEERRFTTDDTVDV